MTIQPAATTAPFFLSSSATSGPAVPLTPRKSDSVELTANGKKLSADQQKQIDDLKKRDVDVKQHEAAHLAAAGGYARSGAVYDYQTGPDGKRYAVGGHVDIDTSPVPNNPKATIQKEQTVERAALAPADPSGQDRSVAAEAASAIAQAQAQLNQKKTGRGSGGLLDVSA